MNYNDIIKKIRDTVSGIPPDREISDILYRHGCLYILSLFKDHNEYTSRARLELSLAAAIDKQRYSTCRQVFERLSSMNYAVIKGAVLSQSAYESTGRRKSSDIDFLINRDDLNKLTQYLTDNGFMQGYTDNTGIRPYTREETVFYSSFSHQTAPFIKRSDNKMCYVNVDVNTDIIWGESGIKTDMDDILKHNEETEIYGIIIKKLDPAMEFISLCLHHYKDMNSVYLLSGGSMKMSLFFDIRFYLLNNKIDINELASICRNLNIQEYVFYCLYYADMIFNDKFISGYLQPLKTDKGTALLDSYGLNDSERKKWNISFPERLLDPDSGKKFYDNLDNEEKEKVLINNKYM